MYTLGYARHLTSANEMLLRYPVSVTEPPLKKPIIIITEKFLKCQDITDRPWKI